MKLNNTEEEPLTPNPKLKLIMQLLTRDDEGPTFGMKEQMSGSL